MKKKMRAIKTIILAVLLFGLAACTQNKQQKLASAATQVSDIKYTCPMHPQIMEDKPGSCPICGMTLVKRSGQASEDAGINLQTVLQPVNSSVIAAINTINPVEKEVPLTITADGYLDFDARTFNNIAARFSGRIEKLYVKYAFQEIKQGEHIYDIYSPDMVTGQQNLLFLIKNSPNETELILSAKQKLQLAGMTDTQINQVIRMGRPYTSLPVYSPYSGHVHATPLNKMGGVADAKQGAGYINNDPLPVREGMYVEKGQTLFNLVNAHHLWAILKIDRSDIGRLKLNQQVTITMPDMLDMELTGKVNFIEPLLRDGDKTTTVRVYLDNMMHDLKVNSLIKGTIKTGTASGLWVPRAAITDLGQTKMVWLKAGSIFKAQKVDAGLVNGNEIEVIKGLSVTDTIAVSAQYLTDSESFIKIKENEK
jgi:Cu(I)/Ag(I) efflux system membrane fusion protein